VERLGAGRHLTVWPKEGLAELSKAVSELEAGQSHVGVRRTRPCRLTGEEAQWKCSDARNRWDWDLSVVCMGGKLLCSLLYR